MMTDELRRLFAAPRFHRDDRIVFNHVRPVDRAAVKIGRDAVPDSDDHGFSQMALSDPARHQVSESNALNCAIAGEHPVLNCVAGDSGGVSFQCRICLYSTSVQQTRATPNAPNICSSLR
jgi:hypothetical protein